MTAATLARVSDGLGRVTHSRLRMRAGRWWMLGSALVAAAAASIPLVYLVVRVAEAQPDTVRAALTRSRTWELTLNTLALVAAVSVLTLVLGVAAAWALERTALPGRRWWLIIMTLPLAMPSYVAAFGWIALTPLRGFWGSLVVLVLCNMPLVMLPTVAALRLANPAHEDVARTLGRSRWQAFREATWPQIRPAAFAGTLLVALYALAEFGTVALMRFQALTWAVHTAYSSQFDRTLAAVLSIILAVLGIGLVVAERRLRGRSVRRGTVVAARTAAVPMRWGRGRVGVIAAFVTVTVASLGVPLAALARYMLNRASTAAPVEWSRVGSDAMSTVTVAAGGAAVALVLALPIGLVAARIRSRVSTLTESASYIGLALPGIVVGLSLVFFSLNVVPGLYQTVAMLAFAYGVLFLPKAVGTVRSSVEQVEPGVEEVARTLGASMRRVWWTVTARIAWPGIGAGIALVALTAMKELPATLMLRPTGMDTLATSLWRYTDAGTYAAAAPYALGLIVVAAIPAIALTRQAVRGQAVEPT